jgi:hypothetical protein
LAAKKYRRPSESPPAALMSASSIIVATNAILLKRVEPTLRGPAR